MAGQSAQMSLEQARSACRGAGHEMGEGRTKGGNVSKPANPGKALHDTSGGSVHASVSPKGGSHPKHSY